MSLSMPMGTAVWMVRDTSLTFEQIAAVCEMHVYQVEAIADGDNDSTNVIICDPTLTGEISTEEIQACQKDSTKIPKVEIISSVTKNNKRYTPIARRGSKPNAILWLLNNYPDFSVQQIVSLIGTTPKMVKSIKEGVYWNMKNVKSIDPMLLRLCTPKDLEAEELRVKVAKQIAKNEVKFQQKQEEEKLDNNSINSSITDQSNSTE